MWIKGGYNSGNVPYSEHSSKSVAHFRNGPKNLQLSLASARAWKSSLQSLAKGALYVDWALSRHLKTFLTRTLWSWSKMESRFLLFAAQKSNSATGPGCGVVSVAKPSGSSFNTALICFVQVMMADSSA